MQYSAKLKGLILWLLTKNPAHRPKISEVCERIRENCEEEDMKKTATETKNRVANDEFKKFYELNQKNEIISRIQTSQPGFRYREMTEVKRNEEKKLFEVEVSSILKDAQREKNSFCNNLQSYCEILTKEERLGENVQNIKEKIKSFENNSDNIGDTNENNINITAKNNKNNNNINEEIIAKRMEESIKEKKIVVPRILRELHKAKSIANSKNIDILLKKALFLKFK